MEVPWQLETFYRELTRDRDSELEQQGVQALYGTLRCDDGPEQYDQILDSSRDLFHAQWGKDHSKWTAKNADNSTTQQYHGARFGPIQVRDELSMQQVGDLLAPMIEYGIDQEVFDSFSDVFHGAWENDRDEVVKVLGSAGALGGLLAFDLTNSVWVESIVGVGVGTIGYDGFKRLHANYGPKSLVKGTGQVAKNLANGSTALPPAYRGICTAERAKDNYYIIDPPFVEADGGEFERILREDGGDGYGLGLPELEDAKRIRDEDTRDACKYVNVILDPTDNHERVWSFVRERFDEDYGSLAELEDAGLLYHPS